MSDSNFEDSFETNILSETNTTSSPDNHVPRDMIKTIQIMEQADLCCHPEHLHSFQQVTFNILSSLRKCASCQERLKTFGNAQVVCVACGVMAHRSCAMSKQAVWNETCSVNVAKINAMEQSARRRGESGDSSKHEQEQTVFGDNSTPALCEQVDFSKDNGNPFDVQVVLKRPFEALSSVKDALGKKLSFGQIIVEQDEKMNSDKSHETTNVLLHTSQQFSNVARVLQENIMEHFRKRAFKSEDSNDDDSSYVDITTGEPPKQSAISDRIGTAAVVGGIAGGVAGLAFAAGPAIAMAGAVGVFAESSVSVGVFMASMATGSMTARQIQERIEERRVLTMGEEGVGQKILLVRPSIQIDPIWETITAKAYSSRPKETSSGNFDMSRKSLFFNDLVLSRERYHRDVDIVRTAEEEIPTDEKVLLLVSRLLNDKSSLPGHIYRELVEVFRMRCEERASAAGRFRRDDAHAVIKHVTATLLQVRAEFSASPYITERTASAVESLVFGQIYTLVWDEILVETADQDEALKQKVTTFNLSQYDDDGNHVFAFDKIPSKLEKNLSQSALDAIRELPQCHTSVDKLANCVQFLQLISEHCAAMDGQLLSAESLLQMVCQHLWICMSIHAAELHAEITFLEEFARDEQLLRGREGYALVTLQAALHFLDNSTDLDHLFNTEEDEDTFENIPDDGF